MGCKRLDEREEKLKGKRGRRNEWRLWRRKAGIEREREAGGEGRGERGGREGGRERRVDLWGLKHISIHGEEEATDSRETEGPG